MGAIMNFVGNNHEMLLWLLAWTVSMTFSGIELFKFAGINRILEDDLARLPPPVKPVKNCHSKDSEWTTRWSLCD